MRRAVQLGSRILLSATVLSGVQCQSALPTPEVASPDPTLPLMVDREAGVIRDQTRRALILRGFNYSGLEFGNFIGEAHGPKEADMALIGSYGANVLRLPIAWSYLEPTPGNIDLGYLTAQVDPLLKWAEKKHIFVVLEMHQFYWSPCTGGNGAPKWVCDGHNYGPPGADASYKAQTDFWAGVKGPDGVSLIDHYLKVWKRIAERYRDSKTVIGFDFMNEPMDLPNATTFEHEALYPFYRRAKDVIRGAGAPQLIVLEPPVIRNLGLAAKPEPIGDPNTLYAPHLYTTTGGLPTSAYSGDRSAVRKDYERAQDEAVAFESVLWVGEFGGVTSEASGFIPKTALGVRHAMVEQNAYRVGSALWAFFPGGDVFSVVDRDRKECKPVLDAFISPYPRMVAGHLDSLSWDQDSGAFSMVFREDETRSIPDPTVIFVPKARHYAQGFDVTIDGTDRAEWDEASSTLSIFRDPNKKTHSIQIVRKAR